MSEAIPLPVENPRRLHLDLVLPVLFSPRRAFARIAAQSGAVWLTPLLILTIMALIQVGVAGQIRQQAALAGGPVEVPPELQWMTPEDQAQFQQAMAATQGPVFIYVFPALLAIGSVWIGWLLVGGIIHLALTLLGGRGATGSAINLVAWSSLPFAVRSLVRIVAMLVTHQLINRPGLSGFAPQGEDNLAAYLAVFFSLIDIYIIWHIVLLIIGVRAASGLSIGKSVAAVVMVILSVSALQALLTFGTSRLASLTVIRPFF